MVVLAASICTRGGKALLSRQFVEIQKSRVEALLASFPKLADSSTQHTTVESENVRFVYQPLDELYLVLITNKQSNILQDIDSLHLFGQVVTSICKKADEREILRHAFELLSAFDELVTMGYRENLSLSQIKTFLEMESHEERIQEIIARNKELEASEERKRKAKQLELQRKEAARSTAYGRSIAPKLPQQPTYTPPTRPESYDTYEAEKNKTASKFAATRSTKGMQLNKKSKTSNAFAKVQQDLGPEELEPPPTIESTTLPDRTVSSSHAHPDTSSSSASPITISVNETLSAKLSREGALKNFEVKGDLQVKISDPALTKLSLSVEAVEGPLKAQFRTHPNVDRNLFTSDKIVQLKDTTKRFPTNNSIGVLRWRATAPADTNNLVPITFTAWVNKSDDSYTITIEYELLNADAHSLNNVVVTIPYSSAEPAVSSFDAVYQVTGDSLEWTIGTVDSSNPNGAFEFEAQTDDDSEFFPIAVNFELDKPFIQVDVLSAKLLEIEEDVDFEKVVKAKADGFVIE